MLVVDSAVLGTALALFLVLLGVVVAKYIRYRWCGHGDSSDDESDDDASDDDDEPVGATSSGDGEQIALIAPNQQGNGAAVQDASMMGKIWASFRDMLSLPVAAVEKTFSLRATRRSSSKSRKRVRGASKKFHKPYFYPLLEETAQWWEAQCQLQAIKVESPPALVSLSSPSSGTDRKTACTAAFEDPSIESLHSGDSAA